MTLKNKLFNFLLTLSLSLPAQIVFANEEPVLTNTLKKYRSFSAISLNYVNWNDKLILQANGISDVDSANYTGLQLNYEKDFSMLGWGWATGASVATGKATAGGNSVLIPFQKGNQPWYSAGGYAKIYLEINPRVLLGAQIPIVINPTIWKSNDPTILVSGGKVISTGILLDVLYRLTINLDFMQSLGFYNSSQGSTLWKLGLGYRL